MTAINVVTQKRHDCTHVLTDGVTYAPDGTVLSMCAKVFPIPHWPGVVATRGPALATAVIGQGLSRYRDFDEAVECCEQILPSLVALCDPFFEGMPYSAIQAVLAGWSSKRERPESYLIQTDDERPDMPSDRLAAQLAGGAVNPDAYRLIELPNVACTPAQGLRESDLAREIGYEGIDEDEDPGIVIKDLRLLIELQRRTAFPYLGREFRAVGGFGQLTTITKRDISTRIIARWPDDVVGSKIEPQPVANWPAYFAFGGNDEGLSRLQRERMLKKAKKGTLRVI